jgi:hypothetical protein
MVLLDSCYDRGRVWWGATLGDQDKAFRWLEQAYQAHDENMILLKVMPTFDPVRDDPRFRDLLRRMRFPT